MGRLRIVKAGMASILQDQGRYGYQSKGISVSGAMDRLAAKMANILVGNDTGQACIEMTMLGDRIEFESDTMIALCGADMDFKLNDKLININRTIHIVKGDQLSCGYAKDGMRAYLAVRGGFALEEVLGSKSSSQRESLGLFSGRKLETGDCLNFAECANTIKPREIPIEIIDRIYSRRSVRFTFGSEKSRFTEAGIDTFCRSSYEIGSEANRMGYRLNGPSVQSSDGCDIISGAVNFGSIQVPGNGQPIIMMADCQTVGGYIKIGQVVQADLPYLAQRRPGDQLRFEAVSISDAIEAWKAINKAIDEWASAYSYDVIEIDKSRYMKVSVNGIKYNVRVSEEL